MDSALQKEIGDLKVTIAKVEVTNQDIMRRLDGIEHALKGLQQSSGAIAVLVNRTETLESRVSTIESHLTWVIRIVVGAVIGGVLSLVVVSTKADSPPPPPQREITAPSSR